MLKIDVAKAQRLSRLKLTKGWPKLFEDPIIAEAIVSRLEKPSQRNVLSGGECREKLQTRLEKLRRKCSTKNHVPDALVAPFNAIDHDIRSACYWPLQR